VSNVGERLSNVESGSIANRGGSDGNPFDVSNNNVSAQQANVKASMAVIEEQKSEKKIVGGGANGKD
jgi:hypothetical protein